MADEYENARDAKVEQMLAFYKQNDKLAEIFLRDFAIAHADWGRAYESPGVLAMHDALFKLVLMRMRDFNDPLLEEIENANKALKIYDIERATLDKK